MIACDSMSSATQLTLASAPIECETFGYREEEEQAEGSILIIVRRLAQAVIHTNRYRHIPLLSCGVQATKPSAGMQTCNSTIRL